ncbi:MAG: DUF4349 domain-containing protein [Elainellaceae cyanobacterium]
MVSLPIRSHPVASRRLLHLSRQSLRTVALSTFLVAGLAGGCASQMNESFSGESQAPELSADMASPEAQSEASNEAIAGADVGESAATSAATFVADVPQAAPQLVKRAELALEVEDMDEAIRQTMAIARSQGGDVTNLQNQTPYSETATHNAFMELRVPQARLDDTLNQLDDIGTINRQALTAEDVSAQLVDFEARLRNLRKAEEMTLDIMERSGEIGEVLQVAQELRNIRASIEQIDGQLSALKSRVSYSTIALSFTRPGSSTPSQIGIFSQLNNSWKDATRSMAALTVDLVQLGIWILVYSPYWLVVAAVAWFSVKVLKRNTGNPQASDRQSAS